MTERLSLSIDDLVGREFEGFFQRVPDLVSEAEQYKEFVRLSDIEFLSVPNISEDSNNPKDLANRRYKFSVRILHFDSLLKYFIGRGEDLLGASGLVGEIRSSEEGEEIQDEVMFTKIYAGKLIHKRSIIRFPAISYSGRFLIDNSNIILYGTYVPNGRMLHESGVWRLESIRK